MADKPKKWMQKATANAHGQFRAKAEHAGETTRQFAQEHKGDSDKTGKQARLALALMGSDHSKARRKRLYNHSKHED
jgi:hypothetical protein